MTEPALPDWDPDEELGGTFALDKERLGLDPEQSLDEQVPGLDEEPE